MYLIPIAWLYVVILVAAAEDSIVAAVLTFVFWGLAPLALFLWVFGTPARRRRRMDRESRDRNDRAETGADQ
jgi:membrane protein implicated in regulation of membrane protease activity